MWLADLPRPDHGPGFVQRVCTDCRAEWVGQAGDGCWWCQQAAERQLLEERRLLLDPPWLRSDAGHHRYDELGDADRAVWDRTRGQTRNTDSVASWAARLGRAARMGVITQREMRAAIRRMTG